MKNWKYLFFMFLLNGCLSNHTVKHTYWDEISKTRIRTKMEVSNDVADGFCYRYYRNGKLLSHTKYENNRLMEIYVVCDSLGNNINFGKLKHGTGYVTMFDDITGTKFMEGNYIDGLRQGWWKSYSSKGYLIDSIFFKDGIYDNHEYYLDLLY